MCLKAPAMTLILLCGWLPKIINNLYILYSFIGTVCCDHLCVIWFRGWWITLLGPCPMVHQKMIQLSQFEQVVTQELHVTSDY